MNLPEPIEIDLYVPHPEAEGMLQWTGRLTPVDVAAAIDSAMRAAGLYHQFEWAGLAANFKYADGAGKSQQSLPERGRLSATWEPGGSEGYIVRMLITTDGKEVCIWNAKMFSVSIAVAAHMLLMHLFFWEGTGTAGFLHREIARLLVGES